MKSPYGPFMHFPSDPFPAFRIRRGRENRRNRMKSVLGVVVLLAWAAQPAFAQGYSTSFDDLTNWLPGSTNPPVNWANDGTPSTVPGGAARTGANSLNYNNGTTYDSPGGANAGPVFSPVVPLTGLTNPTLSFWCNFQTQ